VRINRGFLNMGKAHGWNSANRYLCYRKARPEGPVKAK